MKKTLLILATLAVAGCAQTQQVQLPTVELSTQWRAGPTAEPSGVAWWKAFKDATLNELESQALAENLDIQQVAARIEQARIAAGLAQASLAPSVNLYASAGRVQQSLNSGLGTLSNFVPNYARVADPGQVALSATWDLDFAGGLRSQREAAGANLEARTAELQAVRLTISAEVAEAYFTALGARFQKAALTRQLDLLSKQLRIMEARVRVGAAAQVDLDRIQSAIEETTAPLSSLTASASIQKNRLALLLGRNPSSFDIDIDKANQMPVAADPSGGVPVDILRRRPDVLAAEKRVAGAGANVAASMAEYYPRISLSAALGQDTSNYANLDSSRSSFEQSFLGLRWRLFDFGRIDAEVKMAKGKEQESLLAYRSAVLRAASEVESSFSQLAAARDRLKHLEEQGRQNRLLAKSVQVSFKVGSVSEDDVCAADRIVAFSDFNVEAAKLDVARAIVSVARGLGGPIAD
jgi:NodT family efflux transporter outer membrane factor (OMF) lipoprotein